MNQQSDDIQQSAENEVIGESPEVVEPVEAVEPEKTPSGGKERRFWSRDVDAEEAGPPAKSAEVLNLETQLAEKDHRLQATLVQYKEALDEFEGAKARLRRDISKEIETGKRAILAELLDVVDNLERALEAGTASDAGSSLTQGVTMVRDQFLVKLQGFGVKRLTVMGLPFDPVRCEAVSIVPVAEPAQDGVVVGCVRSCYLIGEETLRYGMVAVGKAVEKAVEKAVDQAVSQADTPNTDA